MNNENQRLLDKAIKSKLKKAMTETDEETADMIFDEAIKAIKVQTDLDKVDVEAKKAEIEAEKINIDTEKLAIESKRAKRDLILRGIEIGVVIIVPIVEVICRKSYAKDICNFEKDYTFTTSAGKGLGSLFRFKG